MTSDRRPPNRRSDADRSRARPPIPKPSQQRHPAARVPVPQPAATRPVAAPAIDRVRSTADSTRLQSSRSIPPYPPPKPAQRQSQPRRFRIRWPKSWLFWALSAVVASSGIGLFSIALLLKLPALPNCPAIFWPTASASLRLYCAQVAANKQTAEDLLEAIALVNSLPADHPLRPEVNRYIEEWSLAVLNLGEEAFDQGDLSKAIALANRIPADIAAHELVEEQIQRWQSIWAEAEAIYQEAETALRQQDLQQAFTVAVRLLSVDNTYWETTKYEELTDLITAARQDGNKLARATRLADRGGLSNLLAAIELAEEIKSSSPAHPEAQRLIKEFGRDMLDLAEATLEQRDSEEAIAIARQIPTGAGLQAEAQDFTTLAQAQAQAWNGNASDLETAIIQAQRLRRGRPLYGRAQQLISRWQLEIQDLARLETAQQLARSGTVEDLAAAIAEAELIPRNNPRSDEARSDIAEWTREIQTSEDRPRLDQAEQFASGGDITSLQAAINEASRIDEGRALYAEARRRIQEWTGRMQRLQDQPYLDQARQLADLGNLSGAIATAEQVRSGRALYREAQADIRTWRDRVDGQARLQEAYQTAGVATPSALASAIRIADQVPTASPSRSEADRMINLWSQEILRLAQNQAEYDLLGAIAAAESIPPRTEAYAAAQLQLNDWRQRLSPLSPQ